MQTTTPCIVRCIPYPVLLVWSCFRFLSSSTRATSRSFLSSNVFCSFPRSLPPPALYRLSLPSSAFCSSPPSFSLSAICRLFLALSAFCLLTSASRVARIPGDILIGGMFPVHKDAPGKPCAVLREDGIQVGWLILSSQYLPSSK